MNVGAGFSLSREAARRSTISLVPMIDIFMILLVFFMVTSTYLDLDTVSLLQTESERDEGGSVEPEQGTAILVRIGADGLPVVRGQSMDADGFKALLIERLTTTPDLEVLLLPSGAADVQALVTTMDIATLAGATRLRLIRLAGRP